MEDPDLIACPDHLPDWVPEWRAKQKAKREASLRKFVVIEVESDQDAQYVINEVNAAVLNGYCSIKGIETTVRK